MQRQNPQLPLDAGDDQQVDVLFGEDDPLGGDDVNS